MRSRGLMVAWSWCWRLGGADNMESWWKVVVGDVALVRRVGRPNDKGGCFGGVAWVDGGGFVVVKQQTVAGWASLACVFLCHFEVLWWLVDC